ncbi:FAD-dependent oxidoreductase [Peptoniphilus sp. KCTC 25270]|uniref:NAD(P)/FAD-dependent oxidoreductase n=1 Tax=Peptoniphilus sp. KCTC 25270 TaxID=2897414 RepID=UPI001E4CC84C|nr:FAD-dependent oxidoreductase [Peptoniphilus sp. KCTC 25270]
MNFNYAIVGNGIAGYTAAKEIRKNDKEGTIVLISEEPYETYYRIKITELICEDDTTQPYVCDASWYEEHDVDKELNARVKEIIPEEKRLILENGKEITADKILLAVGASAFVPPIKGVEKKGIFALRKYEDLIQFREYVEKYDRVAVLGGGILGLEAAESLKELGKEVSIIDRSDYVMTRQLNRELGLSLNEQLKDEGYSVYLNKNTECFLGDDKVEGIQFDDGTSIEVDAVLMSMGVRPNLELVKDTAIEINRGILVNEKMETSVEGIYAAGDVVEVHDQVLGLWTASMEMGKVAGSNLSGVEATYDVPKLFTKLDMGDVQIFSVGAIGEGDVYKYDEGVEHHRLFVKDGIVTGAILYGNTKAMGKVKNYVYQQKAIADVQEEVYPFTKA